MRRGLIAVGVILAVAACSVVAIVIIRRPAKVVGFPLSMATLEAMTDGSIGCRVERAQILVSVVDRYGDAHIHVLSHEGMSEAEALARVAQKKAELEKAASNSANKR